MIQLRHWLVIISAVLMVSCLPEKKSGGGPRPAAADANCGSRTTTNCTGNANCQVSGTQCVGTLTYCNSYQTEISCPGSSCQWSMSTNTCSPIVPFIPTSTDATAGSNCSSFMQASTCPTPACVWNGVSCVASTNSTTPTNPTTNPGGGQPPVGSALCDAIGYDWWRCKNTAGCDYYYGIPPKLGCHAAGLSW